MPRHIGSDTAFFTGPLTGALVQPPGDPSKCGAGRARNIDSVRDGMGASAAGTLQIRIDELFTFIDGFAGKAEIGPYACTVWVSFRQAIR